MFFLKKFVTLHWNFDILTLSQTIGLETEGDKKLLSRRENIVYDIFLFVQNLMQVKILKHIFSTFSTKYIVIYDI